MYNGDGYMPCNGNLPCQPWHFPPEVRGVQGCKEVYRGVQRCTGVKVCRCTVQYFPPEVSATLLIGQMDIVDNVAREI